MQVKQTQTLVLLERLGFSSVAATGAMASTIRVRTAATGLLLSTRRPSPTASTSAVPTSTLRAAATRTAALQFVV